jgi:hypothetical protein
MISKSVNLKKIGYLSLLFIALFVFLVANAQALKYEEKPSISVSMLGSNQLKKGEERTIVLTLFNDAKRVRVEYKDEFEASFFKNEEMLFTAYNLTAELVDTDGISVETPPQSLPALPSMQPVSLQYTIKVSENASPGDYTLLLKISYERIDKLKRLEFFPIQKIPKEFRSSVSGTGFNITITNTTIYEYKSMTREYRLEYVRELREIPLNFVVKEEDVKLEVLNVTTDSLIGGGKGRIAVEFRNIGEKTARDAYVTLETPSGFEASALSVSQPTVKSAATQSMPLASPLTGFPMQPMQIPQSKTALSQANAAYYIGDLKPGDKAKAVFYLKVDVKDGGFYPLKMKAVYVDEFGSLKESEAIPFGIEVKDAPRLIVKAVESRVFANAKGEVSITIEATSDLKDATLSLRASPPISVLSSEYYIGELKSGEERTAVFRVKASNDAKAVSYPAEVKLRYRTMDEYSETNPVEIGISVSPKLEFVLEGRPIVNAGDEEIVEFQVKNAGDYEVRDATARLTIVDPFSSTDDTAFVGDLGPGEVATIKFKLKADGEATPKLYALNLEVKYRDPEGEWVISDPIKATIEVAPKKTSYLPAIVAGLVVVTVVAALAYRGLRK